MSDDFLRLIPIDPAFVPQASSHAPAAAFLAHGLGVSDVKALQPFAIVFVDPGANLQTISCPNCHRLLHTAWWQSAVDQAARADFRSLMVSPPCCGATVSLNGLHYNLPAGFASFILEVANPPRDMTPDEFRRLTSLLNTPLRKVWAHY